MTFEELAARLDELESTRQTAQRELAALEGKRDELRALEQDAAALLETYENTIPEQLDNLTPEERHHIYKLLQLRCLLRPDAPPELTGVFMANAPKVRKTGSPYTNTPTLTWPKWRCCFREEGLSSFVQMVFFRLGASRIAFSRTHADVKLLEEGRCEA